jgi:hypothetical protein
MGYVSKRVLVEVEVIIHSCCLRGWPRIFEGGKHEFALHECRRKINLYRFGGLAAKK